MSKIALMPHTHHLLPGGRLDINVIEGRFIRMMKEALSEKRPFALCMLNEGTESDPVKNLPAIVTLAKIIDFNQTDTGLINIVVEGLHNMKLSVVYHEYDGLFSGEATNMNQWPFLPINSATECLAEKLKHYFATNPEHTANYDAQNYRDASWVCQRWIEIVPIEVHYKQLLMAQDSPKLTIRFLLKLFQHE
ncbi:LON peptidase substrate-binding domain-containing protein [Photobacterium swingsii]|uniref:LON peptidase substrate-binding domain-containing protein n=1 Tax=Photobacterium swingsii TaxID=680026 RepID=UPI00352D7754